MKVNKISQNFMAYNFNFDQFRSISLTFAFTFGAFES